MLEKKNRKILQLFFKMAAIAAILDFGPSPKFNGMILGPYLTPPHQVSSKSVEEFFRNTVHKQQKGVKTVTSDLRWWLLKIECLTSL